MDSTLRVCAVQMAHGASLDANLAHARELLAAAAEGGAGLALLPEYFFATFDGTPDTSAAHASAIRAMLAEASRALRIAVAGTLVERRVDGSLTNVGVVYEAGRAALEQPKVHPMPREAASGVMPGESFRSADVRGRRAGMLVCADILYPEAARVLGLRGADLLLNPVMSPWRAEDDGREARVAMYVARAYDARAFVVKAAGFKEPAADAVPPFGIAGRSLVAAPWGVLARAADDFTEELLFADLDFAKLASFREHQAGFPARRPDAYRELVE